MSQSAFPYSFITIEGNIGAGKTTLCQKIADDFNCKLILEQFADNPFLPFFYENPDRYAFTVELFFMTERHKQLQTELAQQNLFHDTIVADYFFLKTLLFARHTLPTEEFRLFQRLFNILNASFPKPDLLVYLHRPIEDLLKNIRKRGREYEQDISPNYLQKIQNAYFDFFKTEPAFPVLIIDVEELDYLHLEEDYQKILHLLDKTYPKGISRVKLKE